MDAESPPSLPTRSLAIIFGVSIVTALGNTGMQSVLPAIGRSIGFPDYQVAAIFSLSAILWAFSSPFWARRSDIGGRKPMMLVGLFGFLVSMICCGAVVGVGVRHLMAPLMVFVLFLLARALFGLFGAASNPATQAYIAERTARAERTSAMAGLAGAFGLGTIVGPAVAPLFVLPVVGLAGPMFAFALMAAAMMVVVAKMLPETRAEAAVSLEAALPRPKGRPLLTDPRLTPFLVYGFLVAACQTAQGQTLGFVVIDQLGLPPLQAQGYTAVAMMAGAVAGLLAQWGLIRMFRMSPRDLLRWGAAVAALGNLITAFAHSYQAVVIGFALSSLGYGFCRPGFTAGASLAVSQAEQARAAGAIAAVNGVNAVVAPLFVILYGASHPAPFVVNAALLAALVGYAIVDKVLARAGAAAATEDEAALASLERDREGVSV
ncbi:MAG TPA: MFS transporter [Caulobacteraceae bacterium]|jgi:MFS family permease|nr:MFS transporter [Caulobacteraceae bacterium]